MNRPASVGLLIAVLAIVSIAGVSGPILAAGGGGAGSGTSPTVTTKPTALQGTALQTNDISTGDFDSTVFEITVHENGSATWTFRHKRQLDGDSEDDATRASFEEFATEFESTETELYQLFTEQAQAMVQSGSDATGREMAATNFNRSAHVSSQLNPVGIVEMSFTWDGFAAVNDDRIVVGDVFQDGLYLTEDQSIVVEADDGLRFQHIEPDGETFGSPVEEADSVTWYGEQEFFTGHPRVVFTPADGTTGEGASSTLNDTGDLSWPVVAAGFVVLLAAGSGAVWYRRQQDAPSGGTGTAVDDTAHSSPPEAKTKADTNDHVGGHTATSAPHDSQSATASSAPAEENESSTESDPLSDEELLTDEDRVVKLIRENGGRMKQVNIVEETGWSKSKVSMLLSDMEDEGTISKLRVGRENIISLDGFEPEATKSPFDEQ